MAIPLSYNLRNLTVRKTTTIMTALGIALTVAVLLAVLALVNGLRRRSSRPAILADSGDAQRRHRRTEQRRDARGFQELKSMPGIARDGDEPMASLEMVTVINLPSVDSPDGNECDPPRDSAGRH